MFSSNYFIIHSLIHIKELSRKFNIISQFLSNRSFQLSHKLLVSTISIIDSGEKINVYSLFYTYDIESNFIMCTTSVNNRHCISSSNNLSCQIFFGHFHYRRHFQSFLVFVFVKFCIYDGFKYRNW